MQSLKADGDKKQSRVGYYGPRGEKLMYDYQFRKQFLFETDMIQDRAYHITFRRAITRYSNQRQTHGRCWSIGRSVWICPGYSRP